MKQREQKKQFFTSEYKRNYEEAKRQQELQSQLEQEQRDKYNRISQGASNQYQQLQQFAASKKKENLEGYYVPQYERIQPHSNAIYQPLQVQNLRNSKSHSRQGEREVRGTQPTQNQMANQNTRENYHVPLHQLNQNQNQMQNLQPNVDEQIQANMVIQEEQNIQEQDPRNQIQQNSLQNSDQQNIPSESSPHNRSSAPPQYDPSLLEYQQKIQQQDQEYQVDNNQEYQDQMEGQQVQMHDKYLESSNQYQIPQALPFASVPGNSEEHMRYIKRLNAATAKQDIYYQTYINSQLMTEKERYRMLMEMQSNPQKLASPSNSTQKTPRRPLGKIVTQIEMNNPETRKHLKQILDQQIQEKRHRELIESAKIKAFQRGMLDQQMKYNQEIGNIKNMVQPVTYQQILGQNGTPPTPPIDATQSPQMRTRLTTSHIQRYDQNNNYNILSGNNYEQDELVNQQNFARIAQQNNARLPPRPQRHATTNLGGQRQQLNAFQQSASNSLNKNLTIQPNNNFLPSIANMGYNSVTPQQKLASMIPKSPLINPQRAATSSLQRQYHPEQVTHLQQQQNANLVQAPLSRSLQRLPSSQAHDNLRGYSSHKQFQNVGLQQVSGQQYQYE